MYVRFVTPLIDRNAGVECGIFRARDHLAEHNCAGWIADELSEEFDWFRQNLGVPKRFSMRLSRRVSTWGVCWFRPEAHEAIRRARRCAWLIEEGGLPVRCLTWRSPARIVWCDGHQIVAVPNEGMPRGFH